jgi:hypothetical protein
MKKERMFFLTIIIILAIIIYLKGCGGSKEPIEKLVYDYKTDTLYIDRPFEIIKTITEVTPPRYITKYKTDTVEVSIEVIPNYLQLKIAGLQDSIKIHQQYLAKYPGNSKLIEFKLNSDTFDITLLDTAANIFTRSYPIDLKYYKYQFRDNDLHHEDINYRKPKKKLDFKSLYASGGYDFISKSPTLGLDYTLNFNRIRVSTGSIILLNTNPTILLQAKLGLRLLK